MVAVDYVMAIEFEVVSAFAILDIAGVLAESLGPGLGKVIVVVGKRNFHYSPRSDLLCIVKENSGSFAAAFAVAVD